MAGVVSDDSGSACTARAAYISIPYSRICRLYRFSSTFALVSPEDIADGPKRRYFPISQLFCHFNMLPACTAAVLLAAIACAAGGGITLEMQRRDWEDHEVASFLQFIDDFHMSDLFDPNSTVKAPTVTATLELQNWANVRCGGARAARPAVTRMPCRRSTLDGWASGPLRSSSRSCSTQVRRRGWPGRGPGLPMISLCATGSSNTWVFSSECQTIACSTHSGYDKTKSTTYEPEGTNIHVRVRRL